MANVAFLWHMHQPYYVDPVTRTALMPWVRLHAVKGYLDMISVIEEFPDIRVNFNMTPVLMLQIKELAEGSIRDLWLDWARKPAADLDEHERLAVLENFFKIHWDNLLKPFPRYWELLNKRGLTFYREDVRRGLRYFTTQEMLDVQVWHNLAWCGYTAERLYPELAELKRKGRNFSEAEKQRVLDIHIDILRRLPGLYRAAEERGQAELTTTPFYHPILPLVYDSAFAERCLPGRQFPKRFHWPQDAAAHLTLAVEQHREIFGRTPRGLWPSEGSIAPELIPLMEGSGIRYFCSDEENLFNSIKIDPSHRGRTVDHLELFQGWRVEFGGASVNAVFREKPLSDFIGFMAAKNEPAKAAAHLLDHMRHIAKLVPHDTGLIPLILDGENAWETFADGGEGFLRHLYAGISAEPELLRSSTIEDYFQRQPPAQTLTTLHTGSWISSNFDIWIGEDEENRAWDILGDTRNFLQRQIDIFAITPAQQQAAMREIYAAEGSDWFWWYGPDFSTDNDALFDKLFRQHLKNVYTLCGHLPPAELDTPISRHHAQPLYERPTRPITPKLTGSRGSYFEWAGAGSYIAGSEQGAMYRAERFVSRLYFGSDETMLHLRLDLVKSGAFSLVIDFQAPAGFAIRTSVLTRGQPQEFAVVHDGKPVATRKGVVMGEIVEMSILLADLGLAPDGVVAFQVRVMVGGVEQECYPEHIPIQFTLPGQDAALKHWMV